MLYGGQDDCEATQFIELMVEGTPLNMLMHNVCVFTLMVTWPIAEPMMTTMTKCVFALYSSMRTSLSWAHWIHCLLENRIGFIVMLNE